MALVWKAVALVILQGRLFDDYYVNLHEDAVTTGGSWQWRDGQPVAYGPASLRFFYHRLMEIENPVYLDIGANTGSFAQLTAIVIGSKCYAFEPNPKVMDKLQCNIHHTGLSEQVMCLPLALWNEPASLPFHVPHGDNTGMARLKYEAENLFEGQYQIEVLAMPLDDVELGLSRVDAMKIDVEGAELMVLQGAERIIGENKPGIMLEWWPKHCEPYGYHPKEIDTFLGGIGYEKEQVSVEDVYYRAKV